MREEDLSFVDSHTGYSDIENAQRGAPRRPRKQGQGKQHSKSKKHKHRSQDQSGSDSEASDQGIPNSFRENKENRRIDANMVNTRGGKKKGSEKTDCEVKDLADALKATEAAKAENEALRKQLALAQADNNAPIRPKSRGKQTDEEKKWQSNVQGAVKKFIWGKVKFITTDRKLLQATSHVFECWQLKEFEGLKGDDLANAKARWVTQNLERVRIAINDIRNYSQSQLKTCICERLIAGEWVPTPEDVMACATRDPEYHTDQDKHKIFEFYWDTLLFKVVGKEHWDGWVRHYATISEATVKGTKVRIFIFDHLANIFEPTHPWPTSLR